MPSFQPRNGFSSRRFDDRGADYGDCRCRVGVQKIADQRFGKTFGERVGVGPAEFVRAPRACVGESLAQPPHTVLADLIFQRGALQVFRGVFSFSARLRRSSSVTSGESARASVSLDEIFQRLPFFYRVEIGDSARRIVFRQFFQDAAVALADYVASGKMQQRGVIAFFQKIQDVRRGTNIHGQGVAQVGVEIGEAGAVDDDVDERARAFAGLAR